MKIWILIWVEFEPIASRNRELKNEGTDTEKNNFSQIWNFKSSIY